MSTDFANPLTLINCTLANNLATGIGKKGAAIYAKGLVKLFNNIIWHNLAEAQTNLIYITSTGSVRNADVSFPSPLNQAKNLIKGGNAAITAEAGAVVSLGNTAVTILANDPLFLNSSNPAGVDGIWKTADDGFRLQPNSPALDAGLSLFLAVDTYDLDNDGNLTELIPVDFAGYDRIQGMALDLGAYEAGESFRPVTILTQPASITRLRELAGTFTVAATGYDLHYQWYLGSSGNVDFPISGATENSYTSPELTSSSNYWVRVSNGLGYIDSQTASATVIPILITTQPASTTVAVGATASLSIMASGDGLTYQWYRGPRGETSEPMAGANLAAFTTPALPTTAAFWVRVMNAYGTMDSDAATVSVVADPLAAALNLSSSLSYTTGGDASWFYQSATTHDGSSSAQSGVITHSQSTFVQTTVTGFGTISFWWKVSSDSGYDYLRFYIDGAEQTGRISGTTGTWAQKTFTVAAAGVHTFKWAYTKDSSGNSGSDCGWVDEVIWTPKLVVTQPVSQYVASGMTSDLSVTASGMNLTYQWYAGDSGVTTNPISDATLPTYTTPILLGTAKYWVKVGNGVSYESSAAATVTVFPLNPAIATALDSGTAISYFTWGSLPWTAQSSITHGGASALQSGAINHSQSSITEGVVTGAGVLSFWWKASSELGFDFLKFSIDGVEQGRLSGEIGWQQVTFNVSGTGVHKLKWVYAKDESKTSGSDRVWLDQVSWQAAMVTTTFNSWASNHNLTDQNALTSSNPTGDGVSNLMKYALGLNPNLSALSATDGTKVGMPRAEVFAGVMKFTFIKDTAKSDLTYVVESCDSLATWAPVTTGMIETPLTGTLIRVDVNLPTTGKHFCRLKVVK